MAYTITDFKSKKALKDAVRAGEHVGCYQPGLGPDLYHYTGTLFLEGPHYPKPHAWYAEAEMVDGRVTKVR